MTLLLISSSALAASKDSPKIGEIAQDAEVISKILYADPIASWQAKDAANRSPAFLTIKEEMRAKFKNQLETEERKIKYIKRVSLNGDSFIYGDGSNAYYEASEIVSNFDNIFHLYWQIQRFGFNISQAKDLFFLLQVRESYINERNQGIETTNLLEASPLGARFSTNDPAEIEKTIEYTIVETLRMGSFPYRVMAKIKNNPVTRFCSNAMFAIKALRSLP